MRRATLDVTIIGRTWDISIHALLAESDQPRSRKTDRLPPFLSTLSLRRATIVATYDILVRIISIHALLAESDYARSFVIDCAKNFYPRSPCGERLGKNQVALQYSRFLSTLSLRRATRAYQRHFPPDENFYPRSPCGERLEVNGVQGYRTLISIHALLAESDGGRSRQRRDLLHFYPRSPCGERHMTMLPAARQNVFLSTLSLRRATIFAVRPYDAPIFLSTLSLRRATTRRCLRLSFFPHFYPRSPCGERQDQFDAAMSSADISIHALLAESDIYSACCRHQQLSFLSTLSLRRATYHDNYLSLGNFDFYPRSPCGERRDKSISRLFRWLISIHALLAESDQLTLVQGFSCWMISIHALLAESDPSARK